MNVNDKVIVTEDGNGQFLLNGIDCSIAVAEYEATVVSVNGKTGEVVVKIADTDSGPVSLSVAIESVRLVP